MQPIHKLDPGLPVTPRPASRRARRAGEDEQAFEHELEHAGHEHGREHEAGGGSRASREDLLCAPPGDDEAGRKIDLTA